ncbi:hypothetical protein STRIP9103_08236 [Streptomyces ipomoeae 91-03]|uniref:Uncharacterized protein n=1 Tax=Streptomyces ipomoeae 91-03 TaxID=698759 RepID=L1L1B6_9ACTN|nr:hypothetical protein STRIP9103_08236 [Streptomyces ipomoeae 91-03]
MERPRSRRRSGGTPAIAEAEWWNVHGRRVERMADSPSSAVPRPAG